MFLIPIWVKTATGPSKWRELCFASLENTNTAGTILLKYQFSEIRVTTAFGENLGLCVSK